MVADLSNRPLMLLSARIFVDAGRRGRGSSPGRRSEPTAAPTPELLASPAFLGVAAGLVVSKTVALFGSTYLVARFTRAELGEGIAWTDLLGVALVAGIGFTVSASAALPAAVRVIQVRPRRPAWPGLPDRALGHRIAVMWCCVQLNVDAAAAVSQLHPAGGDRDLHGLGQLRVAAVLAESSSTRESAQSARPAMLETIAPQLCRALKR